ncbi:MAG: hypothetical protein IT445_19810 [Phycisphaeraceae bacterium]|nr:hypothetical protein [Phycisphaeraceae bacterium]
MTAQSVNYWMLPVVCKGHDIPKPYPGYWAKLEHGRNPRKTPLPKNDDPAIQSLTFYKIDESAAAIEPPPPEPVYDPDIQQLLDKARSLPPVVVAESLHRPHPLVAATRDRVRANRVPYYERSHDEKYDNRPTLDVTLTRKTESRGLRMMDALIKRIEKIGGSIEIKKEKWREYRTQTVVCFAGEEVSVIRLREKHNQVRLSQEKRKGMFALKTELQPSGLLILDRGSCYASVLLKDTPRKCHIEDGLNDLIIDFVRTAGQMRIKRREEEEERRRHEEQMRIRRAKEEDLQRRRQALAELQNAEKAKLEELVNHAKSWQRSRLIRDYLDAVGVMVLERDGAIELDGEAASYLRWGYQQADRLDPLRPTPHSVLDERVEV